MKTDASKSTGNGIIFATMSALGQGGLEQRCKTPCDAAAYCLLNGQQGRNPSNIKEVIKYGSHYIILANGSKIRALGWLF
jgi:hypothetical protein